MSKPDEGEIEMLKKFTDRAMLSKLAVGTLSLYLIVFSFSLDGRDGTLLGIERLAGPAFFAAGVLGLPMLLWPRTRTTFGMPVWLGTLGLACVGRTFTVIFGDDYTFNEGLRASGWLSTWLLALVAVLQIQASEVLRRRDEKWTG